MKQMPHVNLVPLQPDDREQFITDNQRAFYFGAVEEFGTRDEHFEADGEIISRQTIEQAIDGEQAETYRILYGGKTLVAWSCASTQIRGTVIWSCCSCSAALHRIWRKLGREESVHG